MYQYVLEPMNKRLVSLLVVGFVIVAFSLSGCIGNDDGDTKTAHEIATVSISGSTTVMPFAEACAEEFNRVQDEVKVMVTGGGSGVGIKNVATGLSDIAMASRPVKPDEVTTYGDNFQEYMVAYDAIAIVVSEPIYQSGVVGLSQEEIAAVYNGEITNWKELGGPDEKIYVAAREVGSGTRDTFNKMVMGSEEAETPGVITNHGSNAEVKTVITSSDKAIGYQGLNYAHGGKLHAVSYDGIEPSAETIKDGSYPLARALLFYSWGEPDENSQKFLDFVIGKDGQRIAEETGFVSVH